MEPVSGVWGFVLFWGLDLSWRRASFSSVFIQITKLISLGREGENTARTMKKILGAVGHFIAQTASFKKHPQKGQGRYRAPVHDVGLFVLWSRTISFLLSSRPVSGVQQIGKQFRLRGYCWIIGFCRSVRPD